jgi:hypothetical protein
MNEKPNLTFALRDLMLQHGLPTMLQALANIMADTGHITGGIVNEVASIEGWLATHQAQSTAPSGVEPEEQRLGSIDAPQF